MSIVTKETILEALKQVNYPGFSRDIVSFGLVKSVRVEDGDVKIAISISTNNEAVPEQLRNEAELALKEVPGIKSLEIGVAVQAPPKANSTNTQGTGRQKIDGVKKIIAVSSGKGGVGKSTFSTNLAMALHHELVELGQSANVGIMDCDVYGPSIPLMMGVSERPSFANDKIIPQENFGIKVMSMGLLVDDSSPVIWRGPMVTNVIAQFAQNVDWGDIDILVTDLPPGTGDAQLALCQNMPVNGAVVVTTPQAAASNVARRGAMMFEKVNVPLLGVAENMSYLLNEQTGEKQYIFGQGGGESTAKALETEFLGAIPLDQEVREGGDRGIPVVLSNPESSTSKEFRKIAAKLLNLI